MRNSACLLSITALVFCRMAAADITITVTPTLAPNANGSPSWNTWELNSMTALEDGLSSYGDPTQPAFYQAQSTVTAQETLVTDFPSWLGQADPSDWFGGDFANELGNRMTFGVTIFGNGQQFSISELGFTAASNDAGNTLGFAYSGGYDYGSDYVGVIFGSGTNPNTYITSGAPTQLVDALYARGSGGAFMLHCTSCNAAQEQAQLVEAAAFMAGNGLSDFTGTYYLSPDGSQSDAFVTGSASFNIVAPAPEPATWLLLAGLLPAWVFFRRSARS